MDLGVSGGFPKKSTKASQIREQLELDILRGQYDPEEHIVEEEVAFRYKCSRTPVREAFVHLVGLGLLVRHSHCGVYVSKEGKSHLVERADACAELQKLCVARAIERMTGPARQAILFDRHDLHAVWSVIKRACGNPVLAAMLDDLSSKLEPFSVVEGAQRCDRDAMLAQELAAAVARGDVALAHDALTQRLRLTIDSLNAQPPWRQDHG